MTNYNKVMSVATPNWLALLMANTTPCDRCPAYSICGLHLYASDKITFTQMDCVDTIRQWLEQEADE